VGVSFVRCFTFPTICLVQATGFLVEINLNNTSAIITVVVPTLNSEKTLDWTLASLAAPEIRVIVADSFSKDKTLRICERWNAEVINVPPGNMYRAINAGLREATTGWVAYVNSDDIVFTSGYLRMLGKAAQSLADVVYGNADYVDASGRYLFSFKPSGAGAARRILRVGHMPFCQPAAIFRRAVFQALGGFDERFKSASDLDFFRRAAEGGMVFRHFPLQPVAAFRLHKAQISARSPQWNVSEKETIQGGSPSGFRFRDSLSYIYWRLSNSGNYAQRMIRWHHLSGRICLPKSSAPPYYE
jgi:glycosyltransferase involved in cell wall biosynthesis